MPSAWSARRARGRSAACWAAALVTATMAAGSVAAGAAAAPESRYPQEPALVLRLPGQGPVPSVTAADDCARGGVDVTASNGGDAPFGFALAGVSVTVGPGRSRTVTVPVAEHQNYRFTVVGPGGFRQDMTGVLTCATPSPSPATGTDRAAGTQPVPVTPRGSPAHPGDRRLAIAGVTDLDSLVTGTVLVLLGAMLFAVRRLRLS
ncbi:MULTISPECIES: phospholipase domain-containing protein [unclassified Streptomyces]|uniref:phospholipase domain-containing protein n=1 Tax=unclassified Streptomyces TaxID=2593676 RepID=UPI003820B8DD